MKDIRVFINVDERKTMSKKMKQQDNAQRKRKKTCGTLGLSSLAREAA